MSPSEYAVHGRESNSRRVDHESDYIYTITKPKKVFKKAFLPLCPEIEHNYVVRQVTLAAVYLRIASNACDTTLNL